MHTYAERLERPHILKGAAGVAPEAIYTATGHRGVGVGSRVPSQASVQIKRHIDPEGQHSARR